MEFSAVKQWTIYNCQATFFPVSSFHPALANVNCIFVVLILSLVAVKVTVEHDNQYCDALASSDLNNDL